MLKWFGITIRTLRSVFGSRRELVLENLVLRQQLAGSGMCIRVRG
jgi:hypothetical protein